MLVDANPVESELFSQEELVYVAVVELPAELGVVEVVGTGHPRRAVIIGRKPRVRHQVKAEYARSAAS